MTFVVVVIQCKVEKPKRSLSQKVHQIASHQDPDIYLHPYYYKVEFLEVQIVLDEVFVLCASSNCTTCFCLMITLALEQLQHVIYATAYRQFS